MEKNIFKYFTNYFTNSGEVDYESMIRVLDKGILITNNNEFDIPIGQLYTLSTVETSFKLLEALSNLSLDTWSSENGFNSANSNILSGLTGDDLDSYNSLGVYEATGTYSYLEWFSETYNFVDNYANDPSPATVLSRGIVIFYNSNTDSIIFSSVETFLKYAEALRVNSNLPESISSVKYNSYIV